jgi:hypothetical protein
MSALRNLGELAEGCDELEREALRVDAIKLVKPHGFRAVAVDAVLAAPDRASDAPMGAGSRIALEDPEPPVGNPVSAVSDRSDSLIGRDADDSGEVRRKVRVSRRLSRDCAGDNDQSVSLGSARESGATDSSPDAEVDARWQAMKRRLRTALRTD